MMKKLEIIFSGSLLLLLVFMGCVSQPEPSPQAGEQNPEKQVQQAPDWFFKTPGDDAAYKYFVGSGVSKTGNITDAENEATGDLVNKIMMYIGVEVSSQTEALGIGSIDEFKTEIKKSVTTKSEARMSGFEIMEKLAHETDDGLILYVLSRYNKQELEKEKKKIEDEIKEKYGAVSIPEQEGKELSGEGKYFQAAIKFIQAADAASNEIVSNARIKFERNINQAMDAIEKINLIPLTGFVEGAPGQPFPQTFDLKVVAGGSKEAPGIPDVNIRISYKTLNPGNSKLRIKTENRKTDKNGMISFVHPVPEFTGPETVGMLLDFDEHIEILDDVPSKWYDAVDALDELVVSRKATFEFRVISNAKNIDTGVVIIDLDAGNNPLSGSKTGPSILQYLSTQQYRIRNLSVSPADLLGKSDFEIIPMLAEKFSANVERAVFGIARILESREDNGKIFVKTSATIQIVNLATQEILLSIVKSVNGLGNTEENAATDSFKRLGEEIGKEILNNLR